MDLPDAANFAACILSCIRLTGKTRIVPHISGSYAEMCIMI